MSEPTEELSIVAVLVHYGATSIPVGYGWRSIRCPFHGDAHASGRVNKDLGAFKCHGCSMKGDAIKLIMLNEKIGYGEAVEFARSVLGQSVEDIPRTVRDRSKRRPLGREVWTKILE